MHPGIPLATAAVGLVGSPVACSSEGNQTGTPNTTLGKALSRVGRAERPAAHAARAAADAAAA